MKRIRRILKFASVFLSTVQVSRMGSTLVRGAAPALEMTLWSPPAWPEEYTDEDGRILPWEVRGVYQNPWMEGRSSALSYLVKKIFEKDESNIPDDEELDKVFPVVSPSWKTIQPARMTWLGHATVLAEVDGKAILTDPMFSKRASPFQFAGPARYRPPACRITDLPRLSAVVISHSHYDHLDRNSVVELAREQPECEFFVPQGLRSWMLSNTEAAHDKVHELSWWEHRNLSNSDVKIAFTPANHWGMRGISDHNTALWGSWAVIGPSNSFYFAGDTGYCEVFKQIGDQYGPFSMAAIPIGAYQPNHFMKYQHVHPGEALQIHKDVNSTKSLGIHWGTFKLTIEPYMEPPKLLKQYIASRNMSDNEFVTVNIGESVQP